MVCSPYTWKHDWTNIENWIGGFGTTRTEDGLIEFFNEENRKMKVVDVRKIPFCIPDPDGTFQYTYSNCVTFRKK